MDRPIFSVFIATSLDGCIARPDGGLDWLEAVQVPGEDYGYAAFAAGIDTHLVGRATYETVLGFPEWPYGGKRVAVWSRRGGEPRHGEIFRAGAPAEVAVRLGAAGARRVYVDGGATISAFLAADLVDDLTISLVPRVLGGGIRLFQPPLPDVGLTLVEARPYASGLVQLRYRRERA
jgi:dihydrofolate reductase